MKAIHTRMGRIAVAGIWSLAAGLLLLLCTVSFLFVQQRQEEARAEFRPPQVFVNNPAPGKTVIAGMFENVSATVIGSKPIVRAELWLDGKLAASDPSSLPGGDSTLYASFDLPVSKGPHTFFVRGIDAGGSIGQSMPMSIVGGPKPEKVLYSVPVSAGDKLVDLARTYSTDPATLANLNPNLDGNEPAPGSRVIVPAPPEQSAGSSDASSGTSDTVGEPPSSPPVTMPGDPPLQTTDPSLLMFDSLNLVALLHRPAAPTELQGKVENCNIKLRWNDNADNEERYDVWMTGSAGTPRVIAALKPGKGGAVWVELTAPEAGNLSFWVEAANGTGGQPSNIIALAVESKCAPPPTKLQIEALELSVSGGHDRNYCYISLQGTPEMRIPDEPQQFIGEKKASGSDLPLKKLVVPIPSNGALDISGECWGWSGKNLDRLGTFSRKFASDTWNGKQMELLGADFKILLVIKGLGDQGGTKVIQSGGEDPSIPSPYEVKEIKMGCVPSNPSPGSIAGGCAYVPGLAPEIPDRKLTWKWDGAPQQIDGFKVYLNDEPYTVVAVTSFFVNPREVSVKLPALCGKRISWRMTAYKGDSESKKSDYLAENTYWLPDCQNYLMVKFDKIYVHPGSSICRWDDIYYWLTVNDTKVGFGGGATTNTFGTSGAVAISTGKGWCGGSTTFQALGATSGIDWPDTVVVPIPEKDIKVVIQFAARSNPGLFQPGTFEGVITRYAWSTFAEASHEVGCGLYGSIQRQQSTDYTGGPSYIGAPPGSNTGPFGLQKASGGNGVDLYYYMQVFPHSDQCPPNSPKDPPYIPKDFCFGLGCVKGLRVPTSQ